MIRKKTVKLGLGLIGIGREWGNTSSRIPNEAESVEFLKKSFDNGIDFFDTAPAYGSSEEKLGRFIKTLNIDQRKNITIATKFGEHWDLNNNQPFVDHSYDALCRSIDLSIKRLKKIDVLQLHKSNPNILVSRDFYKALEYARKKGITTFGASVGDVLSGEIAIRSKVISIIQLPFNKFNTKLEKLFYLSDKIGKNLIINRPFNSGKIITSELNEKDKTRAEIESFKFILNKKFNGVILTGTTSINHLKENINAFNNATK